MQEISSITRNLKIMAKEMTVPIIALSQLSRAVEKQGNNYCLLYTSASCSHRQVRVGPGDFIIISANPIPGNEKSVTKICLLYTSPPASHAEFKETGCFLKFCDEVRRYTSVPLCGVGGLNDPDFVEPVSYTHLIC